ncbi:unnamed protein product [Ilex paraguariensis]|uniref:Uncharacterized protein n=1 Tax=Ilex paraguariensis TaxID=185542 RepID=A0ABC8UA98_9AQUA
MKGKGSQPWTVASRRIPHRTLMLPAVLMLGIVLPFLFVRIAFLVLESAAVCSSLDCIGWRFFGGTEYLLREELTRALLEENNDDEIGGVDNSPASFTDLVIDLTSNRQDFKAFAFKTKAMSLFNPLLGAYLFTCTQRCPLTGIWLQFDVTQI